MFVVLTNDNGAYIHPEGYFNIALRPYQTTDFNDLNAHLTNEHLRHDTQNVIQIPTAQYALFKPFYPQIKKISSALLEALAKQHPHAFTRNENKKIAIFGFDFMVDAQDKVWMIEANHAPCFPTDDQHPLQGKLYEPFWNAFIDQFIEPLEIQTPFERLL